MAKSKRRSYGLGRPTERYNPFPIEATRAPTTADVNYDIGQIWVNTSSKLSYMLTQVSSGSGNWGLMSPGASDVDTINSLAPVAGDILIDGGRNITDVNAGNTVTLNLDDAIVLATSVTTPLVTAAAATDIQITAPTGQDCIIKLGDNAAANKFSIIDSDDAEVYAVDSNGTLTMAGLTVAGAFVSNGGTVTLGSDNAANAIIVGGGTSARAITIGQDAAAHTVAIGQAAAGAITIDTAAGVSIDGATASNFSLSGTGADLTLASSAGRVVVNGEEAATNAITLVSAAGGIDVNSALEINIDSSEAAVADAIRIVASAADGGIDIDSGTGGTTIDSTGAISIDAAAASNFSVSGASIDVSILSAAGRAIIGGEEAATNAITLVSAAGGLDCNCALEINIDSSEAAVADAIRIVASAADGGIDIDSGTGGLTLDSTGAISIDAAAASNFSTSGAGIDLTFASAAGRVIVEAGEDAADAIYIHANAGTSEKIRVHADQGTGDDSIELESDAGGITLTSSKDITVTGTVKEIDAEFLYSSGTDLVISQSPILQSNANTGAAPTGGAGDVNLMYLQDGCLMEQYCITAQTIIAPRMDATAGLSIGLDLVDDNGAEYNFGMRSNAKHVYTVGTDVAFFMEAQIYAADLSGCEPLIFGFRKVQANDADYTNYTDFYGIGLNNATSATNVTIFDRLNSGGITLTDTGTAWTGGDGGTVTLKILVSAARVITATIDGGAPSTPVAMTFDADEVAPFLHFMHDTTTPGVIGLKTLKIGYQA